MDTGDGEPIGSAAVWRFMGAGATVGIFLLLFIGFLDLARNVLLPVVAAIIIGTVLDPAVKRAERLHIPPTVFAIAVVCLLVALTYVGMLALSGQVAGMIDKAPELAPMIREKLRGIESLFALWRRLQDTIASSGGEAKTGFDIAEIIKPVLTFLTPALGELLVFFTTLFLFLIDRTALRRKLILVFSSQDTRLRAIHVLNDIQRSLTRYIGAVTVINFAVGLVTTLLLYLFGFPKAPLWGVIAFVLNFIPYIGPGLMVVGIFLGGLVVLPTIGHAILAAGLFVGMATLEGHFITPTVIGHNFRISSLATFLSLAFWTWLWGPVGTFLAIPLLIAAMIVLDDLFGGTEIELPE